MARLVKYCDKIPCLELIDTSGQTVGLLSVILNFLWLTKMIPGPSEILDPDGSRDLVSLVMVVMVT